MAEKTEKKKENAIQKYIRETSGELRKVTWPTPQEAWRMTRIVLLTLLVMALILGSLDFAFSRLITLILS